MNQSLTPAKSRPLANRSIVITRAREQAAEFAAQLEALGAQVITLPLIQIADPKFRDELEGFAINCKLLGAGRGTVAV